MGTLVSFSFVKLSLQIAALKLCLLFCIFSTGPSTNQLAGFSARDLNPHRNNTKKQYRPQLGKQ